VGSELILCGLQFVLYYVNGALALIAFTNKDHFLVNANYFKQC
jgi:hypothetical protein